MTLYYFKPITDEASLPKESGWYITTSVLNKKDILHFDPKLFSCRSHWLSWVASYQVEAPTEQKEVWIENPERDQLGDVYNLHADTWLRKTTLTVVKTDL